MSSSYSTENKSSQTVDSQLTLAEHSFFSRLNTEQQQLVLAAGKTLNFASGEVIFKEGTLSDAIYLVLKGVVHFYKERSERDEPHIISSCEVGEYFGEIGILTKEGRALSARAGGNVEVVKIPADTVNQLITHGTAPLSDVLESIIRHLQNTTQRYISEVENQEKLALVGMMMSSILHDFKNPFSLVNMATHLLRSRNSGNEELIRYCNTIDQQIERMSAMMSDLIAFSQGQETVNAYPFHLTTLKEQLVENISHFYQRGGCKIDLEFCDGKISADCGKIMRALINLIDNAYDAVTTANVPNGFVKVSSHLTGQQVIFKVEDNGPGIPESIREHFFEPFVTYRKKGGTGLGLAITKSVVEAHSGTIDYTTESGRGTCFTIQLPIGDL